MVNDWQNGVASTFPSRIIALRQLSSLQPIGILAAAADVGLDSIRLIETVLVTVSVETISTVDVFAKDVATEEESEVVGGYAQEQMEDI